MFIYPSMQLSIIYGINITNFWANHNNAIRLRQFSCLESVSSPKGSVIFRSCKELFKGSMSLRQGFTSRGSGYPMWSNNDSFVSKYETLLQRFLRFCNSAFYSSLMGFLCRCFTWNTLPSKAFIEPPGQCSGYICYLASTQCNNLRHQHRLRSSVKYCQDACYYIERRDFNAAFHTPVMYANTAT